MSTNFPPSSGPKPPSPYGYGQPAYTGPPSNASSSGGAVVMIVVALGVVILLGLACAGAAAGFLFFARASQQVEMARMEADVEQMQQYAEAMQQESSSDSSPPISPVDFTPTELARAEWSYPNSPEGVSGIIKQDASGWIELRNNSVFARFSEVARTAEYVEIYDSNRQLYVRMLGDHLEWRREGQEWFRGQDGSWKQDDADTPIETPPQP